MNRLLRRRPSPAMVVALVALFVALGGTTYAGVTLPRNSVGSAQLKDRAVTARKLARNAVNASRVKVDSLTGGNIAEATLVGVNAQTLEGKPASAFEVAGTVRRFGLVRLTNGQVQDMLKAGPLTITARCRTNVSGKDFAEVLISTAQNGVAFDAKDASTNLTSATPEADREFATASSAATGQAEFGVQTRATAIAPDGTVLTGSLFTGVNLLGVAGQCVFGGFIAIG